MLAGCMPVVNNHHRAIKPSHSKKPSRRISKNPPRLAGACEMYQRMCAGGIHRSNCFCERLTNGNFSTSRSIANDTFPAVNFMLQLHGGGSNHQTAKVSRRGGVYGQGKKRGNVSRCLQNHISQAPTISPVGARSDGGRSLPPTQGRRARDLRTLSRPGTSDIWRRLGLKRDESDLRLWDHGLGEKGR